MIDFIDLCHVTIMPYDKKSIDHWREYQMIPKNPEENELYPKSWIPPTERVQFKSVYRFTSILLSSVTTFLELQRILILKGVHLDNFYNLLTEEK